MSRPAVSDDQWACLDAKCAQVNPNYKNQCSKCGKSKPRSRLVPHTTIGKDQAEKSKGLFSADDWACSKCGNVNWARRSTCNMCNAPKVAEVAPRTGYGGGFMDRETVEYKDTKEDDDYDEYGRRKKKRRVAADGTTSNDMNDDDGSEYESEEEDETVDEQKYSFDDIDVPPIVKQRSSVGDDVINADTDAAQSTVVQKTAVDKNEDDDDDDVEDEDDLSKYDLVAEVVEQPVIVKHVHKADEGNVSDCSCSCSGGSCSCSPSPSPSPLKQTNTVAKNGEKRGRDERNGNKDKDNDRRRSRDRSRERHHSRDKYRNDDKTSRHSGRDDNRGKSSRDRSRSRDRRRR